MERLLNNKVDQIISNGRGVMLELNSVQMASHDKIYLSTILKRQYYVLKDLYHLHDKYPELIDIDIVGSLDCLFKAMHDMAECSSCKYN